MPLTITTPAQSTVEEYAILAMPGGAYSWRITASGFSDKMWHVSFENAMSRGVYNQSICHTIDPVTAVAIGLMTVDELVGYPEGFKALLNLLK